MKLVLLILLVPSICFSFDTLYEFTGKKFKIKTLESERIVNDSCNKDCIAKKVSIKPGKVMDGEDPAAIACLQTMEGGVLQMHDGKQNEISVCVFKDGSFLTFDSIRSELHFNQ